MSGVYREIIWLDDWRGERTDTMTRRSRLLLFVVLAALLGGCTKIYGDGYSKNNGGTATPPTAPTPTPPTVTADTIEFRVFGNVGLAPVLIKYTNSVDGLSVLATASLPYIATVKSTDLSLFLYIEAGSTPTITTAVLQVQIYVNGRLFREGYASGIGPLSAIASGTYRH